MKPVTGFQTSDGAFFEHKHDAVVREAELALVATIETSIYKPTDFDVPAFFILLTKHCNEVAEYTSAVVEQQKQRRIGLHIATPADDELEEMRKGKKVS
jgi:hypothetical protein